MSTNDKTKELILKRLLQFPDYDESLLSLIQATLPVTSSNVTSSLKSARSDKATSSSEPGATSSNLKSKSKPVSTSSLLESSRRNKTKSASRLAPSRSLSRSSAFTSVDTNARSSRDISVYFDDLDQAIQYAQSILAHIFKCLAHLNGNPVETRADSTASGTIKNRTTKLSRTGKLNALTSTSKMNGRTNSTRLTRPSSPQRSPWDYLVDICLHATSFISSSGGAWKLSPFESEKMLLNIGTKLLDFSQVRQAHSIFVRIYSLLVPKQEKSQTDVIEWGPLVQISLGSFKDLSVQRCSVFATFILNSFRGWSVDDASCKIMCQLAISESDSLLAWSKALLLANKEAGMKHINVCFRYFFHLASKSTGVVNCIEYTMTALHFMLLDRSIEDLGHDAIKRVSRRLCKDQEKSLAFFDKLYLLLEGHEICHSSLCLEWMDYAVQACSNKSSLARFEGYIKKIEVIKVAPYSETATFLFQLQSLLLPDSDNEDAITMPQLDSKFSANAISANAFVRDVTARLLYRFRTKLFQVLFDKQVPRESFVVAARSLLEFRTKLEVNLPQHVHFQPLEMDSTLIHCLLNLHQNQQGQLIQHARKLMHLCNKDDRVSPELYNLGGLCYKLKAHHAASFILIQSIDFLNLTTCDQAHALKRYDMIVSSLMQMGDNEQALNIIGSAVEFLVRRSDLHEQNLSYWVEKYIGISVRMSRLGSEYKPLGRNLSGRELQLLVLQQELNHLILISNQTSATWRITSIIMEELERHYFESGNETKACEMLLDRIRLERTKQVYCEDLCSRALNLAKAGLIRNPSADTALAYAIANCEMGLTISSEASHVEYLTAGVIVFRQVLSATPVVSTKLQPRPFPNLLKINFEAVFDYIDEISSYLSLRRQPVLEIACLKLLLRLASLKSLDESVEDALLIHTRIARAYLSMGFTAKANMSLALGRNLVPHVSQDSPQLGVFQSQLSEYSALVAGSRIKEARDEIVHVMPQNAAEESDLADYMETALSKACSIFIMGEAVQAKELLHDTYIRLCRQVKKTEAVQTVADAASVALISHPSITSRAYTPILSCLYHLTRFSLFLGHIEEARFYVLQGIAASASISGSSWNKTEFNSLLAWIKSQTQNTEALVGSESLFIKFKQEIAPTISSASAIPKDVAKVCRFVGESVIPNHEESLQFYKLGVDTIDEAMQHHYLEQLEAQIFSEVKLDNECGTALHSLVQKAYPSPVIKIRNDSTFDRALSMTIEMMQILGTTNTKPVPQGVTLEHIKSDILCQQGRTYLDKGDLKNAEQFIKLADAGRKDPFTEADVLTTLAELYYTKMKKVLSAHSQFQMYQDAVLIISKTTLVQFVRKETGEPSAPQEHADRLSSRLAASRSASTRSAVKSKVASFAASTTSSRSKGASMPKTRVTSSNTKKAPATQLKKTTQDAQIQQMDRLWKECMSVLFNRGSLLQIPETVKHMVEWAFARIGIFQRPLVNQTANEIFDSDNLVSFLEGAKWTRLTDLLTHNQPLFSSKQSHKDSSDEDSQGLADKLADMSLNEKESSYFVSCSQILSFLPKSMIVVGLNFNPSTNMLYVTRLDHQLGSMTVRLPLCRISSREGDSEGMANASFITVMNSFKNILKESDETTKEAKEYTGDGSSGSLSSSSSAAVVKKWWEKRRGYDAQLRELLIFVESTWFGGFIGLLFAKSQDDSLGNGGLTEMSRRRNFRQEAERLLVSILSPQRGTSSKKSVSASKSSHELVIHPMVFEWLYYLGPEPSSLAVMDILYYILDTLQAGETAGVAYDEIDIESLGDDLVDLISQYGYAGNGSPSLRNPFDSKDGRPSDYEHIVLVPDQTCIHFPWESLPCLKDRSVSRVPSYAFLSSLLERKIGHGVNQSDDVSMRVSFLLNPSGDLSHTESLFGPWLESATRSSSNWKGWIGKDDSAEGATINGPWRGVPKEKDLIQALKESDLFLYFGHGSSEQYVRGNLIRNLGKSNGTNAPIACLFGCSSGYLEPQGRFDPSGMALNYLLGGSPCVVANLWDVTDKDLDRFAVSMLRRIGIMGAKSTEAAHMNEGQQEANECVQLWRMGEAMSQARGDTILSTLVGAAPVIYGLPP